MSDSVQPHRWQPTRLPRPWDSPGKNTGVGCHFLLQCMKVKRESKVAQSCPTFCDPMDCSPPGSSVHGILQARILEWVAISFSISFQSSILLSKTCMKALSPLGMRLHRGRRQPKKEGEERLPSPNQLWRQEPGKWQLTLVIFCWRTLSCQPDTQRILSSV